MKTNSGSAFRGNGLISAAFLFLLLWPLSCALAAQAKESGKLESVLNRMEKASGDFKSYQADVTMEKYDALVEEFNPPEKGKFYYKRAGDGGALIRLHITDPAEKITTISDSVVVVYQPAMKSASRYNLGKNKDSVEYMALGFGKSPEDLKKIYEISYLGSETIDESPCSIIELKPKAKSLFSSITIWIKDSTGISTRMKMSEEYGDYIVMNFSDEKLNEKIDNSLFKQKLPKGTDIFQVN